MTKEGFAELQQKQIQSGMNLKMYLQQIGTSYSTYNYWRKKYQKEEPARPLAPITFKQADSHSATIAEQMPGGATLLFPNGLRAHFGSGTEKLLMELLEKSLSAYVLPQ